MRWYYDATVHRRCTESPYFSTRGCFRAVSYTHLDVYKRQEYINIEIGGSENILNYYHDLVGKESHIIHDIAYLGNKEQKFDISMVMSHGGKKSVSDIHNLGALSGNAKKSFRGTLDRCV